MLVVLFMVLFHPCAVVVAVLVVSTVCVSCEGDECLVGPLFRCLSCHIQSLGGCGVGLVVAVYFPECGQPCQMFSLFGWLARDRIIVYR